MKKAYVKPAVRAASVNKVVDIGIALSVPLTNSYKQFVTAVVAVICPED